MDKGGVLKLLISKFMDIQGIIVTDREGNQLAGHFSVLNSVFDKAQITAMLVASMLQTHQNINRNSGEKMHSATIKMYQHLIHLERLQYIIIIIFLKEAMNFSLAFQLAKDLKNTFDVLNEEIKKKS